MNVALKINDENLLETMEPVSESLTLALLEKKGGEKSRGPQNLSAKLATSLLLAGMVCLSLCLWGNIPAG